jgi:hypothetical protein
MSAPSLPTGYDEAHDVLAGQSGCHITFGFDRWRSHLPRFLVQLHYQIGVNPVRWTEIARMDHNETSPQGHNVYREGLHVDVARRSGPAVHLQVSHSTLPSNQGKVIRRCIDYLMREADYFIDVYEGNQPPGSPPSFTPDGGEQPQTLFTTTTEETDMSRESPADDALTLDELDEVLAEATGTTPEEIKRGAKAIEIAPPDEATVVEE